MFIEEKQLREFIADSSLVSKTDLEAMEKQAIEKKISIGTALVEGGKITEDDLRKVQAYILGIPFVNLKDQRLDFDILSMIPEPIARNHNIVAFRKKDDSLEVAMLDTDDLTAIDFIKRKVHLKILPRLTDSQSIKSALLQYQKSLKAEFGDIIQKESASLRGVSSITQGEDNQNTQELKKMAEDLPVVRIVDTLLKHAVIQNSSDIHIEPMENQVLVRYRIDGILHDTMTLPKNAGDSVTARIKVLSNLKLDEKRLPQDGRFKIELNNEKVSFRVSILPTYFGEKTVMRLLRDSATGLTLEGLGFHGDSLEKIHAGMKQRAGMILTTGPTGSGKTTTLYTVLDILNTPEVNISTVEDPIEYQMTRVNQTQVKPEIGFTFGSGLRSLVRQDPDIIMVGEIRDNETANLAVNASLTGHLVLSTLHTNSAAGAIPRLIDMKIEPFLVVSTVNVVIAQRLVRKLHATKDKYFLNSDTLAILQKSVDLVKVLKALKDEKIVTPDTIWEKIPLFKAHPSPECKDGYRGRVGISETLKISSAVKELILRGASAGEIELQGRKEGMLSMLEDGIFKAVQGVTTIEEVFRVISE